MKLAKKKNHIHDDDEFIENSNSSISSALGADFKIVGDEEKKGKLTFYMPEEYYDPNKRIAKIRIINIHDEVKVIEGAALRGFQPSDVKNLIEGSNDVKKVIIEQVTINDAKRLSLLYNADDDVSSDLRDAVGPTKKLEPSTFLQNLEFSINGKFLDTSIQTIAPDEKELVKELDNSKEKPKGNTKRYTQLAPVEQKGVETPVKTPVETKHESKDESALYRRQTLIRKTRKAKPNDYYYQAKNHKDLFKLGNSYFEDVKAGLKSFCFSSFSGSVEQQKTVFGISAFFNYHSDLKVTIITEKLEDSYYLKFIKNLERKVGNVFDESFQYEYYSSDGIDIVEIKELRNIFHHIEHFAFNDFLQLLCERADITLWDLPEIKKLDRDKEMYFPMTMVVESVSLVVSTEETRLEDIEKMLDYYDKYNVKVKGIIFSGEQKKVKQK